MHRTTSAVLMSALFAGAAAPAFADDLTPAPWRFGAGTTFEHWDFSAGPIGGPPDAPGTNLFNPYGTPIMTPTLGATWLPAASGRTNVWFLGGTSMLTFDVPNTANTVNQKELWLQITFQPPAAGGFPSTTIGSPNGLFTLIGAPSYTALPNNWIHELTRWSIGSCPPFERVSISSGVPGAGMFVDQVVIDTRCFPVPAPGTAMLLGAGALLAARRRR
jgi:hypothetical protein